MILHVNPVAGPAGVGDDEEVVLVIAHEGETHGQAYLRAVSERRLRTRARETWMRLVCDHRFRELFDDIIWHEMPLEVA